MKLGISLVFAVLSIAGCTSNTPTFSWYHPQGGEYLFAFDKTECQQDVMDRGKALGTDTQGPFFACMHQRGYYLVDAQGVIHAPEQAPGVASAQ